MAHPDPPPKAAPRVSRGTLARFLLLPLLVGIGFLVLRSSPLAESLSGEDPGKALTATFERLQESWWAPVALIATYVLLCPLGVPATPMMLAGGAVFGPVLGSLYNVLGLFLAAAATFFLGRALGRDFVAQLAGKRLKRIERQVARRGFWSLVALRFLPLPFPLVNYTAALAGIRPGLFLTTTAIGLAPSICLITYFAAALYRATGGTERSGVFLQLTVIFLLLALLIFIPRFVVAWKRRRRYREIRESRRGRTGGDSARQR